jgi:alpha-tubulin suppressor-like RCC1 family protein
LKRVKENSTARSREMMIKTSYYFGVMAAVAALMACLLMAKPAAATPGSLQAWGENESGQLGNGTSGINTSSKSPVGVSNLNDTESVSADWYHSIALKEDGTVWAWGNNFNGQLGNGTSGTNADSDTPGQVMKKDDSTGILFPLAGVKAIAAGCNHSLALTEDGTVFAWGWNGGGQLGGGTYSPSDTPAKVQNLSEIKAIAAGGTHSLALKDDSTVRSWGDNEKGQLGDGTHTDRKTRVTVKTSNGSSLGGVKAVAAGQYHSLTTQL